LKLKTVLTFLKTVAFYVKRPWFWILRSALGKILFVLFLGLVIVELPDLLMGYTFQKRRAYSDIVGMTVFFFLAIALVEVLRPLVNWMWNAAKEKREQWAWNRELQARLIFEEGERLRHEEERPERLEKELSDIKEQLRRMSDAKPAQPPPKSSFTGSITTEKEALELFEMSKPFTSVELKKRRNGLLQKIHPDKGGSGMMVRLVNDAYEILKGKA